MANTKTGIFDIENQVYQDKLSEMVDSDGFNQKSIDERLKLLDVTKGDPSATPEAQIKALEDWNKLKNLNDAYQKFLEEKANAEEQGLMAQFSFYPGKDNENMFESIEFKLGDGSPITWDPNKTKETFQQGAVLDGENPKFTIAMPLNSTMTVRYPDGPNDKKGETLEFSPGNTVKANFNGSNMQVDEFCKQTLLNWEREKQRTGKSEPIFLDFSTIPPDAQPELKRRVAQTLIDMQADSTANLSMETRQSKRDELIMAITNVSKDGKPAAFSQHDLKELGVDFSGNTNWFNKNTSYSQLRDEYKEQLISEQKKIGFDNLINPVVKAFKTDDMRGLKANEPVVQDLVQFFDATKDQDLEALDDFKKNVEENYKHLTQEPIGFGWIRKGHSIPVEQLHEAWKEVHNSSLANQVSQNSSNAPFESLSEAPPPQSPPDGRQAFNELVQDPQTSTSTKDASNPLSPDKTKGLDQKSSALVSNEGQASSPGNQEQNASNSSGPA